MTSKKKVNWEKQRKPFLYRGGNKKDDNFDIRLKDSEDFEDKQRQEKLKNQNINEQTKPHKVKRFYFDGMTEGVAF